MSVGCMIGHTNMSHSDSDHSVEEVESIAEEVENVAEDQPTESAAQDETPYVLVEHDDDPYLLADATYIKKDATWRNKQRTLVFGSRGLTHLGELILTDLRDMMPHAKKDSKWEKKSKLSDILDVAEEHSCNNVLYLESRRDTLYLWLAKAPHGPTFRFMVQTCHPSHKLMMGGNCHKFSRPILSFDKSLDSTPYLRLFKELFIQAVGTPLFHPKSVPFFDHVIHVGLVDGHVLIRHYQIAQEGQHAFNHPDRVKLLEIGPRLSLEPILTMKGFFSGALVFRNGDYMTPRKLSRKRRAEQGAVLAVRKAAKMGRQEKMNTVRDKEDPLSFAKVFGD